MFQATLTACQRVLGSAHPDTLDCAQRLNCLKSVRSAMRAEPRTKRGGKATARKERAAAPSLSPTALAEVEAQARAAEAELLAMLESEAGAAGSAKGSAKGKKGKRG